MKKLPIRLIAFDLDGTVLDQHKNITPHTLAAFRAAAQQGVILVPATGRALANLSCVGQMPGLEYAITSNGAAIWKLGPAPEALVESRWGKNTGTAAGRTPQGAACAVRFPLAAAKAAEVAAHLKPFLPGNLKVFVDGRSVSEAPSYHWEQTHGSAGFVPAPGLSTVVEDLPAYLAAHEGQVEKTCMFFRDLDTLRQARTVLETLSDIEIVQGSPDNLECTTPGVNKGAALRRLCEMLGVPAEQSLAIGDSENDWAMLKAAGIAASMANATPETQALAAYVSHADNNHDGVAEVLEALVL